MTQHFGEAFRFKLIDSEIVREDRFGGCCEAEIAAITAGQSVALLPPAFCDYLRTMGKQGFGDVAFGSWLWRADELPTLKQRLLMELAHQETNLSFTLPENAFVFLGNPGHKWHYVLIDPAQPCPLIWVYDVLRDEAEELEADVEQFFTYLFETVKFYIEQR